jgi:hypothetical protein
MTDISVTKTSYQTEDRSWLASPHGYGPGETPSVTLSIAAFTEGTHYPNGYIPSGTVLGKITASGLYGPYDDAASDGRQTATGILFGSLPAKDRVKVGGAQLVHGHVTTSKLPFSGATTGAIDAAGKVDLRLIEFR